ncbi:MAG: Ribosomal RNA small subunit methyltransferase A [Chlamydiae bacterium]|nr:Ribosomal RNA small subunit methyltransferase A [Chlamydiota bacterium]
MTCLAHQSTLNSYLRSLNKRPSRSLSQNFLVDANVVKRFIDQANLSPNDFVIEIGPGPGAFTQEIVKRGVHLTVIEKDRDFAEGLRVQYQSSPSVNVIEGDILTCDLESILTKGQKVKIISNLPFQLTSPILGRLFPLYRQIHSCLFIMQKEVADRILSPVKLKAYSSLTVFSQFYTSAKFCFNISPHCFFPKPRVVSSALFFKLHSPEIEKSKDFFIMVRKCFNQRRKMLTSTLPFDVKSVRILLQKMGHSEKARPEELDIQSWLTLFKEFHTPL